MSIKTTPSYIFVTNLSSVQKYIGNTSLITLSDLNTDRWSKSKAKVKKQTDIIAKEIVELYSRRLNKTGYCFSRDDELQKEMEELFEFVETDDQLKVIDEVKNDMESLKLWTDCFVEMLDLEKQKLLYERHLRR